MSSKGASSSGRERDVLPVLLGVILLAFALRMFQIDAQELRGDEAFSWSYAAGEPDPIALVARIVREGDPQPPMHYWLLQIWIRVFGDSEFALRSLSAFLGLLLVPLIFKLARRVDENDLLALSAAGIAAVHPYQIWLAQDVRSMYLLALIGLVAATRQLPGVLCPGGRSWALYVLSASFALYSHYYAIFGLLAHGVYVALKRPARASWLRWLGAGGAIALVVLPWWMTMLPVYIAGQLADPAMYPVADFLLETVGDAGLGPAAPESVAPAGMFVGVVAVLAGAIWLWHRSRPWAGLLLGWPLITLVGIYLVTRIRATYNTFYFGVAFPALYVLFAAALAMLGQRPRRVALVALCGLALIGCAASLYNYHFDPHWSKSRGLRDLAALLATDSRPGDVVVANFPDPATVYYLRRLTLPYDMLPAGPDFDPVDVDGAVGALASRYDRIWHIPMRAAQWDADGFVESRLADRYFAAVDYQFGKTRLRLFVPRSEDLPYYRPLNVEFTQGIKLMGAYVTVNGNPNHANPEGGDWLRVSLMWTATSAVPTDYTVFVHALSSEGGIVGQHDGIPRSGAAPTRAWQPGAVVLDVHEFQLPPESTALDRIVVGMYDPMTGRRLSHLDGGDSVPVWQP
jgi:hypothetical protein